MAGSVLTTNDERQRDYWVRDHRFRPYDHPIVRLFATQRIAFLRSWLDLSQVRRALDVGCGDGFSTYYMREGIPDIWATDRSSVMLARHPVRGEGRVTAADARALPYASGAFDLVYGWEMLHHIAEPSGVVAEMARVSRRHVLLVEPNRNHPAQFAFALLDQEHRWVLRYSRRYLEDLCRGAGLQIERSGCGGYIFPNRTPAALAGTLARLPYASPFGISNWVLARHA